MIPEKKDKLSKDDLLYKTHPAFKEDRKKEYINNFKSGVLKKSLYIKFTLFFLVMVLWWIPIINPIKLMVVLFHEMSHVFAAYLTGGIVFGIAIDPGGAGITLGIGGKSLIILMAGYTGSLIIGFFLYRFSTTWEPNEVWALLCILCCISLLLGWLNSFTAFFGYGAIILMFICLFVLSSEANKLLIRLIATTCCMYPLIDVIGEVLSGSARGFMVGGEQTGSDISQIAAFTGISKELMGAAWIIAGILLIVYLVIWTSKTEADIEVKKSLFRRKPKNDYENPLYNPNNPSKVREYTIR